MSTAVSRAPQGLPQRQAGLGMWGLMFVFLVIGFVALVTLKCTPIYLNHLKVETAINAVADDTSYSSATPFEIRRALQRRWDVDDVKHLKTKDVKIQRADNTRVLSYDYEVKVPLFANISIVIQFKASKRVRA
ncbi:DUF4845 domain-containing protein [bacterium]|nr:DUF4845 domain-containing protein [bacterium]